MVRSLLGLQNLTDLHLVGVNARVQILECLQRDAGLLGDTGERVALLHGVGARTSDSGRLAVATSGGRGGLGLEASLQSGDGIGEGLVVRVDALLDVAEFGGAP